MRYGKATLSSMVKEFSMLVLYFKKRAEAENEKEAEVTGDCSLMGQGRYSQAGDYQRNPVASRLKRLSDDTSYSCRRL